MGFFTWDLLVGEPWAGDTYITHNQGKLLHVRGWFFICQYKLLVVVPRAENNFDTNKQGNLPHVREQSSIFNKICSSLYHEHETMLTPTNKGLCVLFVGGFYSSTMGCSWLYHEHETILIPTNRGICVMFVSDSFFFVFLDIFPHEGSRISSYLLILNNLYLLLWILLL